MRDVGEEVLGKTSGKGAPKDKETWWWNEEVQRAIKKKKEAKKRWDVSGLQIDRQAWKKTKKGSEKGSGEGKSEC